MLLDVYGHYMPTESAGFADAITAPDGTCSVGMSSKDSAHRCNRAQSKKKSGADDPIRTDDLLITSESGALSIPE